MEKWADYGIPKVRYNDERTHIAEVKVHEDKGDAFGGAGEWSRNQVVSALERGKSFITILKGTGGKWQKGQDVHVIAVNGMEYIRTDQNHKASDNLENLPEF